MEDLKLVFLERNFASYPETWDAFVYFQESLEELSIEGMAPLLESLDIDLRKQKKKLKRGHRRDRIRVYFVKFGHPSVQWLGGGIKFEDGEIKPELYFYMSSKAPDYQGMIRRLCEALPERDYFAEPSLKDQQVNICFRKNPPVKSLPELKARMLELSAAVAKALPKALK